MTSPSHALCTSTRRPSTCSLFPELQVIFVQLGILSCHACAILIFWNFERAFLRLSANLDMFKIVVLWSAWAQIELCHLGYQTDHADDDDYGSLEHIEVDRRRWPYLREQQHQGWLHPRAGQTASSARGLSSFLVPFSNSWSFASDIKMDLLSIIVLCSHLKNGTYPDFKFPCFNILFQSNLPVGSLCHWLDPSGGRL